jgi:hypothetical protein
MSYVAGFVPYQRVRFLCLRSEQDLSPKPERWILTL